MELIAVFIVGLAVGSFLNACIYRVPRKISVVSPSSHCPACKHPISARENIPLFSFLVLKGKCGHCGTAIHWRYPLVEFLGGALLLFSYVRFGFSFALFFYYALVCALVVLTFIDHELRVIPDRISLSFMLIGLGGGVLSQLRIVSGLNADMIQSLLGIVIGGGSLTLVAYLYLRITGVEGMGGGDVKLAAMIGAFLGWKAVLMVIFISALGGSVLGLALVLIFRMSRRTPIPFGSFMAPAGILVLFYEGRLLEWFSALSAARAG
jgi:leader peptidase (prepilin peptidase)/N-methyltransferase